MNVAFYSKKKNLTERDESINEGRFNKRNICVDEFEVGVNDSIFADNGQQKVYYIQYNLDIAL